MTSLAETGGSDSVPTGMPADATGGVGADSTVPAAATEGGAVTFSLGASSTRRPMDDDTDKLVKFRLTGGTTGGGPPHYLSKTMAFTAHTMGKKAVPVVRTTRELQTYDKTKWCAEDRESARALLVQMQFKYNFTRNPRFPKIMKDPGTGKPVVEAGTSPFWKVMPPMAEFTGYQAGQVYEKVIEFQNVTGVGRRIRILQPDSPLFTLSLLQYPQENGNVAPGMVATAHVRFSPDSNGDYNDVMRIITETGEIVVPLLGRRQPPRLTLDEKLQSGFCFTGDTVSSLFDFQNEGGIGKFCIVPAVKKTLDPLCVLQFTVVLPILAGLMSDRGSF